MLRLPLLLLLLAAPAARAQATPDRGPANPFAAFESVRLGNGLKVWYGHLPGATLTSMVVMVPYGRDHDPRGREQTAHLLEHVLLSDRHGRSEAELSRELMARGGTHTGITGPHYSLYPLSIGTEQAAYGVRWLYDVVVPRFIPDDLVARNRDPVAIELAAARRGGVGAGGVVAEVARHPRLRPAGFWEREFGHAAQEERGADQRRSLARITAADVRAFYDAHYGPSSMTLLIVGGRPLAELQPVIDSTFGTIPWRPTPSVAQLQVRQTETRRFYWRAGGNTSISVRYRIADLNGRDQLRLAFIEDLLRERLMQRLREGAVKAVYSVDTFTEIRGPAVFFGIAIDAHPRQERHVRGVLDAELARIRDAAADTLAFYADRDALSHALRVAHASPASLRIWAMNRLYRPDLHEAFPDVGEYYATVGPDSIAAYAHRAFAADSRILSIRRPLPLHPLGLAALAGCFIIAAVRLYRRLALRSADMSTIRYVARLRPPFRPRLAAGVFVLAAGLIAVLLLAAAAHIAADRWILSRDGFLVPAAAALLTLFTATLAGLAVAGTMLHKVLVFDDELRLKSRTFRSISVPAGRVRGARIVAGRHALRLRRPSPWPARGAVLVDLHDGTGFLLHVRDAAALVRAVGALRERQAAPAARPVEGQPVGMGIPPAGYHGAVAG
jgi:predicted Zn-dependent peptidase